MKDMLQQSLVINPKKDVYQALICLMLGDKTAFEVQARMGWRLGRAEVAFQESCKIFAPPKGVDIYITTRSAAKSLHDIGLEVFATLAATLQLGSNPPGPREKQGINKALNLALRDSLNDYAAAQKLLTFYITTHREALGKATYPANYLPTIFAAYLRKRPPMPDAIWERAQAKNLTFLYNDITYQWEPV